MRSTVGFAWIIQTIYLVFPRYFKMCCFDFWNVKILCLNEQSFPKLLFFPLKKNFIGTCSILVFFNQNEMDIQANTFEFRVFAQRQFALRDFAIQKFYKGFLYQLFYGTHSCLLIFLYGTETCLFVFAGALKRPIGKNKKKFQFLQKN